MRTLCTFPNQRRRDESIVRLLISCPDRPGIVAAVCGWLFHRGANIIHSDQHSTDCQGGTFFLRQEFHLPGIREDLPSFAAAFGSEVGEPFAMHWRMAPAWERKRIAILVSRLDHVLMDILWRIKRGELPADPVAVISNHPDLAPDVAALGMKFHYVPVTRETREEAEARVLQLLQSGVDVILLARYMQILSPTFVAHFPNRIINIHHSFLPAFMGADPYRQAFERGVKLIGATAHYVTAELDKGPIIEQDVIRVSHRHDVEQLKELGQDIERQVMARAVKWHLNDQILVNGNKTIVFA